MTMNNGDEEVKYTCFYLGDTLCGIDIALVREINDDPRVTPVPLSYDYIRGVMNLRGQIITVIDQRKKLGLGESTITKASRVIIVNNGNDSIGLMVDRIADVITAPRSRISKPPSNVQGLQGAYFQGVFHTANNELLAILDIDNLLAEETYISK